MLGYENKEIGSHLAVSLIISLSWFSKRVTLLDPKSPIYQYPMSIDLLLWSKLSIFCSSYVDSSSPATFLQFGLFIYSFIISIFWYSFVKVSLISRSSPASICYCCFIYILIFCSLYSNILFTIPYIFYFILENYLFRICDILLWNISIL